MPIVGTYNPTTYVAGNPATWPQPPAPAVLYQPGMAWLSTGTGTVDGQPVKPNDLLFAVARQRLYGDYTYGAGTYGTNPAGDWTYADVSFKLWDASLPPWLQPPFPYDGCPFGETGWWIVVDSWFNDNVNSRTYGEGTYGSGVYGGGATSAERWNDITAGFINIQTTVGTDDGADIVDATELVIDFHDPDYTWFDLAPPASYHHPMPGAPIRVGFYDPVWGYHPRVVAEIERIVCPVNGDPRFVSVTAHNPVVDLTRTLFAWQRPAELASARFAALLTAGGWRYGYGNLVFPPDAWLAADREPRDVTALAEIDRTCSSAAWFFDTDLRGSPRLRPWPHTPAGPTIAVVDCADHGHAGLVANFEHVADEDQVLNVATVTNSDDPATVATYTDIHSVAVHGNRDNRLGFPKTELAFYDQAAGYRLAANAGRRFANIVTRVDQIAADTAIDPGWLPALADLDTGRALSVTRVHPDPAWTLDGIVVGYTETITPGRIETELHTTTTTPTL